MDAFDLCFALANKPRDSHETIPAELHHALTSMLMGLATVRRSTERHGAHSWRSKIYY